MLLVREPASPLRLLLLVREAVSAGGKLMKFEAQLLSIKHKADLHKWIDDLPDSATVIILANCEQNEEREWHKFYEFGGMSIAQSVYMLECFKNYLVAGTD
jgi:hypothetical protein